MKNEYKIDHVSMHEDRGLDQQSFGKRRGALERGLRPLERGPVSSSSVAFYDILREGHFGDEIWTTLGLILSCFSSGFLSLLSLYLFLLFSFVFSQSLLGSLIFGELQPQISCI